MSEPTKRPEFPNVGIPQGETKHLEISETEMLQLKKDRAAMESMDKIDYPIECKMYGQNVWTYRNDAYRKFVVNMDTTAKEKMDKMIQTNKRIS
jgi:hypothetical protein